MIARRVLLTLAAGLPLAGLRAGAWAQAPITIGVAFAQDDNPLYIAMLRGVRARAAQLGWTVVAVSSNEDIARQISGVQDLVARGVRGVLIAPIDGTAVNAAYDAAAAARIPIISLGRGATSPNQTLHIGVDEMGIGRDIAEWTARRLDGRGRIAMLVGPAGSPTFRNFAESYTAIMARHPGLTIVFRTDGPLTRERGLRQAEDALVAHPDLSAIYAANDDVALGAVQGVAAAGKRGSVFVTGMNGVPPALRAVRDGSLALTVQLNAETWGRLGTDVMAGLLRGDRPPGPIYVPHALVDAANIATMLPG